MVWASLGALLLIVCMHGKKSHAIPGARGYTRAINSGRFLAPTSINGSEYRGNRAPPIKSNQYVYGDTSAFFIKRKGILFSSDGKPGQPVTAIFKPLYSRTIAIVIIAVLTSLILCTVVGNAFVFVAVLLERSLQRVSNYLILSLAVADLMVAVLVMPISALQEVSEKWWLGVPLCDFWMVMDVFFCTASILHLVGIAVDRYRAVSNVEYVRRGDKRPIFVTIILVWVVAAGISLPARFALPHDKELTKEVDVEGHCAINTEYGFTIISTVGAFFLPMIFLMGIYAKIYVVAMKRIRKMNFRQHRRVESGQSSKSLSKDISLEFSIMIETETTSPSATCRLQKFQPINSHPATPEDVREHAPVVFKCESPPLAPNGEEELAHSEVDHPDAAAAAANSISYCANRQLLHPMSIEQRYCDHAFEHPTSVLSYTCRGRELESPRLGINSSLQSVFWLSEGPSARTNLTPPSPVAPSLALIQSPHLPFTSAAHPCSVDYAAFCFNKVSSDSGTQKKEVRVEEGITKNGPKRRLPTDDSTFCVQYPQNRCLEDTLRRQNACDLGPLTTDVPFTLYGTTGTTLATAGGGMRKGDSVPIENSVFGKQSPKSNGYMQNTEMDKRRFCKSSDRKRPNSVYTMLRGTRRAKSLSSCSRFSSISNGVTSIRRRIKTWKSSEASRGEAIPRRERLEHTRERKAARTLAIITGCFILCWLPFSVNALIRPFCGERCDTPRSVTSFFLWLGYMNSMLNPIIYTIFSPDFRSAFSKIISCRYRSCDTCICM